MTEYVTRLAYPYSCTIIRIATLLLQMAKFFLYCQICWSLNLMRFIKKIIITN